MDQVCDWFASIFWSVDHLYFSRPRYHKISCSVLLKKIKIAMMILSIRRTEQ